MALKALINAARDLDAARRTIQSLKAEKQQLQDRIAAIDAELTNQRAVSDAAIAKVKTEAQDVVTP